MGQWMNYHSVVTSYQEVGTVIMNPIILNPIWGTGLEAN